MAGKKIKCPRCGKVVAIPAAEVPVLEAESSAEAVTDEPPAVKKKSKAASTRPCPECGEPIAITAAKCRHCQAILEEEEEEDRPKGPRYKPCPRCGEEGAKRVKWTPWGSFYGPALFNHVRCPECGYAYNGKSGRSNLIPAIIFVSIPLLIILGIIGALGWYIHSLGYF